MSFLSNILEKLGLGQAHADTSSPTESGGVPPTGSVAPATGATAPVPITQVDVTKKLDAMAANSKETLNWKTSIVDLLKLLGLESDLSHRKELATELGYTGATDDTAKMNIWLHKEVLTKISENGGNIPSELLT